MGRRKNITETSEEKQENKDLSQPSKSASERRPSRGEKISEEEKVEKRRLHKEKILKKQESRLFGHIERVKSKEARGEPANKERFYVTNAKLLAELNTYRETGDITDEFGKMIKMIAERLTNHSNFKNYPYDIKQDMVSYAVFKCMQGIGNYNFKYKNAFAYFTTACYNSFVSTLAKHYRYINLKRDLTKRGLAKLESTANINTSKILNQFIKDYLGEDFLQKEEPEEKRD